MDFTVEHKTASLERIDRPGRSGTPLTDTLDQLLASKTFSRSGQLKRLLLYLRDATDSSDPSVWSETAIGTNAFGRKDFNPRLDTIVRVEMRRLRQKLEEFYETEGAEFPLRLTFEKNSYRPFVEPYIAPVFEPVPAPVVPAIPDDRRFAKGAMVGAAVVLLLTAVTGLIWWLVAGANNSAPRKISESPIWAGYHSSNVVVAVGTPLFFRSNEGFERNFSANLPDDLPLADQLLAHRPAYPVWNLLATFEDVGAAVALDRFLHGIGSTATVVPARQISIGGLSGKKTIIIGQPRGAPLLADLLADQNFRPPAHRPGEHFAGFVNSQPRAGEPARFPAGGGNLLMQSDESSPDFALITRMRLANGGEVLSVFGDRVQTGAYIVRKLLDPAFVTELGARVFGGAEGSVRNPASQRSTQIVYRVDYNRGAPIGLVYVTQRSRTGSAR